MQSSEQDQTLATTASARPHVCPREARGNSPRWPLRKPVASIEGIHLLSARIKTSEEPDSPIYTSKTVTYRFEGLTWVTCAVRLDAMLRDRKGIIGSKSGYPETTAVIEFNPDLVSESPISGLHSGYWLQGDSLFRHLILSSPGPSRPGQMPAPADVKTPNVSGVPSCMTSSESFTTTLLYGCTECVSHTLPPITL